MESLETGRYLAFAEVPDIFVWIGGGVIFASTTYIAYREHILGFRASVKESIRRPEASFDQ